MSKRGLPAGVQMRHDLHYVDELNRGNKPVGKMIAISRIEPNPEQPRTEFGDLTELTESIREKGVLEPLLVKPTDDGRYMIIAGERRWRASNLAGLEEVPCVELDIDEQGVAEIALIENLQRKDLTIWEEADGLKALAEKFGYTQDQIAKKISKGRTTVTELMTVAGLPEGIREKCRTLNISSKSTLLEIARQFDEPAMYEYVDKIGRGEVAPKKAETRAVGSTPKDKDHEPRAEHERQPKTATVPAAAFHYVAFDDSFEVKVQFREAGKMNKTAVLKALKEAFESAKADA